MPASATLPGGATRSAVARRPNPAKRLLSIVASLRLTVVLFALSMVLVFVGTVAQKDAGIWNVVNKYFRSFFVWVPFQVFFPSGPNGVKVGGGFPYPGGWLLGTVLMVNLVAAHAVRFRYTWKRAGIVIIHAGIVLMMVGELVTGLYAVEGNMTIHEKGSSNFLELQDHTELAFVDTSDPRKDRHLVIPENILRKKGARISRAELPFDVEVVQYMANSKKVAPGTDNSATAGYGLNVKAVEASEVSGTDPNQTRDIASAYVRLLDKSSGKPLGTYLVSVWFSAIPDIKPQEVQAGDKKYEMSLRFKRAYKPYTVHLEKFNHKLYMGTTTPKDFSSEIVLTDPGRNVRREVVIAMNSPLRYQGETFYQASFLPNDEGTVLQVVRNPGWLMPYVSCVLVVLGMTVHFGTYLLDFLRRRATA